MKSKIWETIKESNSIILLTHENPDGEKVTVQDHLYAVTLFIGGTDSIDNYIEVDKPVTTEE